MSHRVPHATAALATLLSTAASAQTPQPLLQQLSDQTQQLYGRARVGMVRVRLPTPQWLARENRLRQLMLEWGPRLTPAVRERIQAEHDRAARAAHASAAARPATVPAWPAGDPLSDRLAAPSTDLVLVATGVLVDPAGHVVLPLYIDRADFGPTTATGEPPATLAALTGDGRATAATFVGSDFATKLTVLKLADPGPHPMPLAVAADVNRPADGSVALVVAPEGSAHLTVWTSASADVGLVLRADGTFAGFGFADDFLSAATAGPIVRQLIATGTVRRPMLGVGGVPVRRSYLFDPAVVGADDADDGLAAAGPSAVLVTTVDPGSPAAAADLRPHDVILAVAGRPVGPRTFAAAIAVRNGPTPLRVRRGPLTLTVSVDLHVAP